jgi:hypothetical protein
MLAPAIEHAVQEQVTAVVLRLDCRRNEANLKVSLSFLPSRLFPGWSFADEGLC